MRPRRERQLRRQARSRRDRPRARTRRHKARGLQGGVPHRSFLGILAKRYGLIAKESPLRWPRPSAFVPVACGTAKPSIKSSPWIRGAPQRKSTTAPVPDSRADPDHVVLAAIGIDLDGQTPRRHGPGGANQAGRRLVFGPGLGILNLFRHAALRHSQRAILVEREIRRNDISSPPWSALR